MLVFNTETHSFSGVTSYLKYADYFQLPPYRHKTSEERKDGDPEEELYAWSIYDGLHIMDMRTFEWNVFEAGVASQEMQP